MSFQIHPLPMQPFARLFLMSDIALKKVNAVKMTVTQKPGFPCRVSLKDAEIGETVILTHYEHHSVLTPYKSSHAIFIRENAEQARLGINEVPEVLSSRLLSVRAFSATHDMIAADVVEGKNVSDCFHSYFESPEIAYLHVHNAKPGCYAARVTRVD